MIRVTYYLVVRNMPGYLPETEPVVISDDQPPCELLSYIRSELEWLAPETDRPDAWDSLMAQVSSDLERAADFDPEAGFLYRLPDGYVIDATAHTPEELIALGYADSL